MEQVNYVHIDEGSAYYTELQGILQELRYIENRAEAEHYTAGSHRDGTGHYIHYIDSLEDRVKQMIKALENSIEKGYKIVDPAPEGMMTIQVPVGSYIVPPEEREKAKDLAIEDLVRCIIQAIRDSGTFGEKNLRHNETMLKVAFEAFLNIK